MIINHIGRSIKQTNKQPRIHHIRLLTWVLFCLILAAVSVAVFLNWTNSSKKVSISLNSSCNFSIICNIVCWSGPSAGLGFKLNVAWIDNRERERIRCDWERINRGRVHTYDSSDYIQTKGYRFVLLDAFHCSDKPFPSNNKIRRRGRWWITERNSHRDD